MADGEVNGARAKSSNRTDRIVNILASPSIGSETAPPRTFGSERGYDSDAYLDSRVPLEEDDGEITIAWRDDSIPLDRRHAFVPSQSSASASSKAGSTRVKKKPTLRRRHSIATSCASGASCATRAQAHW